MLQVLKSSWPLLLGMLLLMLGNGIQGSLLGVRGAIEGFSTFEMSLVMSAYFLGFLFGANATPRLIQRVGHVRVFAALGSFTSAVLVLYPALTEPWAWVLLRIITGFCFSGLYVTSESWLNEGVDNRNRGKALSLYMIVQMAGIISAQGLLVLGDPSGFILFIVPSVLVSISFAPILLSVSPSPSFERTKRMTLGELWAASPLGCVGVFLLGGIFSALFGMAAVYATLAGLSVAQISAFIATIYIGGLVMQYPIGFLSDRIDRRWLILLLAAILAAAAVIGILGGGRYTALLIAGFLVGGTANPLYGLTIAYTNDHLDTDRMAGASGGMIFINGLGAISGPVVTGWLMAIAGPEGFWVFLMFQGGALAAYAALRMRMRPGTIPSSDTGTFAPIGPAGSAVSVEWAQDLQPSDQNPSGDRRVSGDDGRVGESAKP